MHYKQRCLKNKQGAMLNISTLPLDYIVNDLQVNDLSLVYIYYTYVE
jgi:hypothetical protein